MSIREEDARDHFTPRFNLHHRVKIEVDACSLPVQGGSSNEQVDACSLPSDGADSNNQADAFSLPLLVVAPTVRFDACSLPVMALAPTISKKKDKVFINSAGVSSNDQ